MIYVTHDYITKKFDTDTQAFAYIKAEMDKHNLSYNRVFDKESNGVRVEVYQYYTLYMEAFIIHGEFELRRI